MHLIFFHLHHYTLIAANADWINLSNIACSNKIILVYSIVIQTLKWRQIYNVSQTYNPKC